MAPRMLAKNVCDLACCRAPVLAARGGPCSRVRQEIPSDEVGLKAEQRLLLPCLRCSAVVIFSV